MITTREFLRLGTIAMCGTLLACASDSTGPGNPPLGNVGPVFTSIRFQGGDHPLAPITGLNNTRLEVRALDEYGLPIIAENASFSVFSENAAVAAVGETARFTSGFNGVPYDSYHSAYITAIAPGEAVISVAWTIGGVTKTAKKTIRVESVEGWSLKVDPSAFTVKPGSAKPVRATVVDADGNHRHTPQMVLFSPDRTDIVTLFQDELCDSQPCYGINVRGIARGEATITARLDGFSALIRVTVE